jgi:hypothetical protein
MKRALIITAVMIMPFLASSQENRLWTEEERNYLIENLVRSREELIKETAGLSEKQWKFKESPDRWSISEVVEHINSWEMLLMYDVTRSLKAGSHPSRDVNARRDEEVLGFIMEEKPHYSLESTKPFSYTIPMGLTDLKTNITTFLKLRGESIQFVETATEDLRLYTRVHNKSTDLHQHYIVVFGHTDRHLRQIRKIKQHANYPKS